MKPHNPAKIAAQLQAMEFHQLDTFNQGSSGVFWGEASHWSPWEMHPDCEELLHVIKGEISLEVLPHEGGTGINHILVTGEFITIPRGCWHRQKLLATTQEYYLTPGKTLHSHSDDPRLEYP